MYTVRGMMVFCVLPVAAGVLAWTLVRRYGYRSAIPVVVLSILSGGIAAVIGREICLVHLEYEYSEDKAYPAEPWRQASSITEALYGLEFQSDEGLFAVTDGGKVRIAGVPPVCLADGMLARYYDDRSSPQPVELESDPRISLPLPPGRPLHQITFGIPIQLSSNTDLLGASSYVVYDNGEIWCCERFVQRGWGVAVASALAPAFQVLDSMMVGFWAGFAAMAVLTAMGLEIRRMLSHRHKMV